MTDKADKVHPIIEAMARALCGSDSERTGPCVLDDGRIVQPGQEAWRLYVSDAKAAAKVLLSAPPNGHMIQAAVQTLHDDLEPTDQELAEIYTAMLAAAREEMGV